MKKYWIHGDVDGIQTDKLPENLIKLETVDGFVLRHGETGHKHQLKIEQKTDVDIYLDPITNLHVLDVKKPIQIYHTEHKTLVIEPGIFIEKAEVEYNPFEGLLKRVLD